SSRKKAVRVFTGRNSSGTAFNIKKFCRPRSNLAPTQVHGRPRTASGAVTVLFFGVDTTSNENSPRHCFPSGGSVMALGAVIKGPNIPFKVVATSQEYGTYDKHKEGISAKSHFPSYMSQKLINGKIWTDV